MDEILQAQLIKGRNLISVLNVISREDFSVSDDTILDKLFVCLENSAGIKGVLDSLYSEISNWLQTTLYGWGSGESKLFHGVQIFIIRFIGYICSTVKGYKFLEERNIPSLIFGLVTKENADPSLVVAFIDTLRTLLKHHDGYIWVTNTKIWRYAVTSYYESKSIYVKRASVIFTSSYLISSSTYGDSGVNILTFICEPMLENNILTLKDICEETSTCNEQKPIFLDNAVGFKNSVFKCATYLCDVFEELLKAKAPIPANLCLVYQTRNGVEESVILSDVMRHSMFYQTKESEKFSLLLIIIELNNVFMKKHATDESNPCGIIKACDQVVSVIKYYAAQFNFKAINNLCAFTLRWRDKLLKIYNQKNYSCEFCEDFEESLKYFVTASFYLHFCCFGNKYCFWTTNSFSPPYIKLKQLIGIDLLTANNRECCCVKSENHYLGVQYIQSATFGLRRCLPYLSQQNISRLMPDVAYIFVAVFEYYETNQAEYIRSLLVHFLTLVGDIIERSGGYTFLFLRGNVHFVQSSTYVLVLKILHASVNDERITISCLQVLNKILKCHLLPEVLCSEIMDHTEPLAFYLRKLSNLSLQLKSVEWEIRDTVLEVYQQVIELTGMTPSYVHQLFNDNLLIQILNVASNDESSYVRASALNFYSSVVRTANLDDIIPPTILCDLALHIILSDHMPLVRRAACELISALYVSNVRKPFCELSEENRMYEVMFAAMTRDLNWEVKKAALNFWQCTIDKHLMEANVPISSSLFPYSTIKDKEDAISKMITVFNKLSKIGCLKAIWLGVTDDCDIKVCDAAENIIEYLEKMDKQWNYIEDIFKQCNHTGPDEDLQSPMYFSVQQFVLLLFENKKWKESLESRRRWIQTSCNNLSSIIDHILEAYENKTDDGDRNAIDCY